MTKWFGMSLLFLAAAQLAMACAAPLPEIDPAAGVSALALLGGALLVLRARRK
jgi:MYXO-CTERM domain-containing protein